MRELSAKLEYDKHMDKGVVVDLCNAINSLPGLQTQESCCGHGERSFQIFFEVKEAGQGLFFLTRCKDQRYWQFGDIWDIKLSVGDIFDNGILPTIFLLTSNSSKGEAAYSQAKDLINNMNYHLNHQTFIEYYGIDLDRFVYREV